MNPSKINSARQWQKWRDAGAVRTGAHGHKPPRKYSLAWSATKMRDYFRTVPSFCFTADTCARCRKTANVCDGAGWVCECGAFNILPWRNQRRPHVAPDYGPTLAAIVAAARVRGDYF